MKAKCILAVLLAAVLPALAQDVAEWNQNRTEGRRAFEHGLYREAEPHLTHALVISQQLKDDDARVITSLHDLADLHRALGRHAQAEQLLRAALTLRERAGGLDSPTLVPDIDALAWSLYSQAKFTGAAQLFRRSLDLLDRQNGPPAEPAARITAMLNLARVLQPLQQDSETVKLLERVIDTRRQWRGPENPEVAGDVMRLGRHHAAQKRAEDAEKQFVRALSILEAANGPMHVSVTAPLDELGALYSALKRFEDAEPVLRRSVTVREWSNGPLSLDLAGALENLAAVWVELKRYPDAEEAYTRALALWELKFGPDHPLLASTLDHLAAAYAADNKFDRAEAHFQRALALRDRDEAANLNNLALVLAAQKKYAEAEPYYKTALALLEKPAPAKPGNPEMLRATLENYRDLLTTTGRRAEAARLGVRLKSLEAKADAAAKVKPANP